MIISELQWDDENVEHIARHDVNPKEVEDICFGVHISAKQRGQRYILSGQSVGGRYLKRRDRASEEGSVQTDNSL